MKPVAVYGSILILAGLCAAALLTPYGFAAPLALLLLAAGAALWRWPVLSIVIIIGFVPFAVFQEFAGQPLILSLPKLAGVAGIGVAAAHIFFGVRPISNLATRLWAPIGVLMAVYVVSAVLFVLPDDGSALKAIRQLATAMILFALVLQFEDQIRISWVARALALIVTIPCLASLIIDTGNVENSRTSGFLGDPNFFAMLIVMALPLTAALWAIEKQKMLKAFWAIAAFVQFAALIQSSSRSGIVVFIASSCLAAPILWRALKKTSLTKRMQMAAGAFAIVVFGALLAPPEYVERLGRLGNLASNDLAVEDRSLGRRTSYWTVGSEMFADSPIIGSGPGSFRTQYSKSGSAVRFASSVEVEAYRRRAHNTYLELASETGLIGLFAFAAIIAMSLQNLMRVRASSIERQNIETYLLSTAFIISVAAGAASLFFISDQTHKFIWFLAALSVIWERRTRLTGALSP